MVNSVGSSSISMVIGRGSHQLKLYNPCLGAYKSPISISHARRGSTEEQRCSAEELRYGWGSPQYGWGSPNYSYGWGSHLQSSTPAMEPPPSPPEHDRMSSHQPWQYSATLQPPQLYSTPLLSPQPCPTPSYSLPPPQYQQPQLYPIPLYFPLPPQYHQSMQSSPTTHLQHQQQHHQFVPYVFDEMTVKKEACRSRYEKPLLLPEIRFASNGSLVVYEGDEVPTPEASDKEESPKHSSSSELCKIMSTNGAFVAGPIVNVSMDKASEDTLLKKAMHGTAPDIHDPSSKHEQLDYQRRQTILQDKSLDSIDLEKLLHTDVITLESTLPVQKKQLVDIDRYHDVSSETSIVAIEHGLEEIKWNINDVRNNPPAPCESIPERVFSEVPNGEGNHDVVCLPTISSKQVSNSLNFNEVNLSQISESCQPVPDHMNPLDAYKLAIGNKSNLPSPNIREVVMGRDFFRAYEALKLLNSQKSVSRVLETPWHNLSPSPRLINWNDLVNVITVESPRQKETSSTTTMCETVETGALLLYRTKGGVPSQILQMEEDFRSCDFETFAKLTCTDDNRFHAVCLDTSPPVFYMNDTSHRIISLVKRWNYFEEDDLTSYVMGDKSILPEAVIQSMKDVEALLPPPEVKDKPCIRTSRSNDHDFNSQVAADTCASRSNDKSRLSLHQYEYLVMVWDPGIKLQ